MLTIAAAYCPPLPAGNSTAAQSGVPWGGIVRQVEEGDLFSGVCLGLNKRGGFGAPESCSNVGIAVHSDHDLRVVSPGPRGRGNMMEIDFEIR